MAEKAVEFIHNHVKSHSGKPFFLYYALSAGKENPGKSFLFNLEDDLQEQQNLYDEYSDVAYELERLLEKCQNQGLIPFLHKNVTLLW